VTICSTSPSDGSERLGLSPRTVGAHVEHILAKLDFTRRAEIAAWVAGMRVVAAAAG